MALLVCTLKHLYPCSIKINKELTDRGQIQYLTGLKGTQDGTYLNNCIQHNFFHLEKFQYFIRKYLNPSWDRFIAPCKEVIITSLTLAFDLSGIDLMQWYHFNCLRIYPLSTLKTATVNCKTLKSKYRKQKHINISEIHIKCQSS